MESVYTKTLPKKGFEKKFGAPEVRVNVPYYDKLGKNLQKKVRKQFKREIEDK